MYMYIFIYAHIHIYIHICTYICIYILSGYIAFFALMLSIGYEVHASPPEGTQVDWPAILTPRPSEFAAEVYYCLSLMFVLSLTFVWGGYDQ